MPQLCVGLFVGEYGDHLTLLAAAECFGLRIKVVTPEVSNTADMLLVALEHSTILAPCHLVMFPRAFSLTQLYGQRPDRYFEPRNTVKQRNVDLIYYPQQKHFNLAVQAADTVVIALLRF